MKTVDMQCADEPGFPVRTFHVDGDDSTCTHCGWMQASFGKGLRELVNLATWSDETERQRFDALARHLGE